ncbi:uncharacterized protein LOC144609508 isoform X2 [Rhinoraja longicauda]
MEESKDSSPPCNHRLPPSSQPLSDPAADPLAQSPVTNRTTPSLQSPHKEQTYFNMTSPSPSNDDLLRELRAGKVLRRTHQATGLTTIFFGSGTNKSWLNSGSVNMPLNEQDGPVDVKPSNRQPTSGASGTNCKSPT